MKAPLAEILRCIRPYPPITKVKRLRELIAQEPRRSIRRGELEAALREIITKQIGRENRQDRRAAS